jgi:hypothetical protein
MAAFVAADVTYTPLTMRKMSDSRNMNRVRLVFGASTETYATGGIPLTKGKMGCPVVIESLVVVDKGNSGYSFMYDQSEEKLLMFVAPVQTHAHNFTITQGVPTLTMGLSADASTGTINATQISANLTLITGSPVVSATLAAAAMSELANATDIATQTIEVEVIGY